MFHRYVNNFYMRSTFFQSQCCQCGQLWIFLVKLILIDTKKIHCTRFMIKTDRMSGITPQKYMDWASNIIKYSLRLKWLNSSQEYIPTFAAHLRWIHALTRPPPPPLAKMTAILADDIFSCIFLNKKDGILIHISLKYVPRIPIDIEPPLVEVIACRLIIQYIQVTEAEWRIYASVN